MYGGNSNDFLPGALELFRLNLINSEKNSDKFYIFVLKNRTYSRDFYLVTIPTYNTNIVLLITI